MKKQICLFLSLLLLLCAVLCPFAAGEGAGGGSKNKSDGPADSSGSADAPVSAGNPARGLRPGISAFFARMSADADICFIFSKNTCAPCSLLL